MKHLTILVPQGEQNLITLVGAYKILNKANTVWQLRGRKPVFKIQLASFTKKVKFHDGAFFVYPHTHINDIDKTHLIIIPALAGSDFTVSIEKNQTLIAWIAKQHARGAVVASLCTGAFLLASSGVLNGKMCSTHWAAEQDFRKLFPDINLVTDRMITEDGGLYTNGGALSSFNLVLHLIEKYYDRETAIFCAKVFEIDIDRNSQGPYTIFLPQKNHGDEAIKRAQLFIENHSEQKISIEHLSEKFSMGRRHFDRRFKKATGNTPTEYIQRAKVETAKKSLEATRKNINEVMYEAGYSDVKAFRTVFKRITGLSPIEYRNKYNKAFSQ